MAVLPDPALELLDRQFGAIGRFQLLEWLEPAEIDGKVRHGALVVIERGVYRTRGGARSTEQTAMARTLRARPGARITGPLVLALINIDGFTRKDPFDVLTRPGRRMRGIDWPHREDPTPDVGRATLKKLPMVTPTIALVDSARFPEIGDRRLRLGLDVCRWRSLTSDDEVLARARLLGPTDPGAAFWLELLADRVPGSESDAESRMVTWLQVFDPAPEPQVWVTPSRRVDGYWRAYQLILEYLGSVDHSYAEARIRDDERARELEALGNRVIPVVAADLRDREVFLTRMTHIVSLRAYELGLPPPRRRDSDAA
ncbi:MAG: hypothetical protein KY469_20775 [Actinobacteria bacterium]|nr:hypothetical protein [Actinomycetota bacterium]